MRYEKVQGTNAPLAKHRLPNYAQWQTIAALSKLNLLNHYKKILRKLSQYEDPLISAIYTDVQTRLKEPKHLEKMVNTLDSID
jgi:type I restriction enzyme M protein